MVPLAGCEGSKTIAEMGLELKDQFNFCQFDKLQADKVEEAYDKMEFVCSYKRQEELFPFPIY
jgi:hypothetical protein